MTPQNHSDYQRIERAIAFLVRHWQQQPSLQEVADTVNLSPQYLQRLFSAWAGVSPKKFLQFLSVEYAKSRLQSSRASIMNVALDTGLSGSGRLHDLFVRVEAMTPGEYKNAGEGLQIKYSTGDSIFGAVLVASTSRGICHVDFLIEGDSGVEVLRQKYRNAQLHNTRDDRHQHVLDCLNQPLACATQKLQLHVAATPFQLKVWQALLNIPVGALATYGELAELVGCPKASRAVGSAVAKNPIAYLIPCHRVIRGTGKFGEYRWGASRKAALIGWEAAHTENTLQQKETQATV